MTDVTNKDNLIRPRVRFVLLELNVGEVGQRLGVGRRGESDSQGRVSHLFISALLER
jgi:hypothetical protein